MSDVYTVASGNKIKFGLAAAAAKSFDITLEQASADIDEIQGTDGDRIVRAKAVAAYTVLQKPVIVTDDLWSIPEIGGFPGAYMKEVARWFTAKNWLDLCQRLASREIILSQWVAFYDGTKTVIVNENFSGTILKQPSGNSTIPFETIVSMEGDDNLSIADIYTHSNHKRIENRRATHVWKRLFQELGHEQR